MDHFCARHSSKKIEAYCPDCRMTLCIDCILTQEHKNHEIVSIPEGSQRERELQKKNSDKANSKKSELEHQIFRIRGHLSDVESQAISQRQKLSGIYSEIKQKIIEREQKLKKEISDLLEQEQHNQKQKISSLSH